MPAIMNDPPKSRFEMILGVKEHEMHHRGQLMLIERIIGIVPHLTREMQARMAAMRREGLIKKKHSRRDPGSVPNLNFRDGAGYNLS